MSTIFWKALKLSPALLSASLLFASSTYARESVPDQTAATSSNQAAVPGKPTVDPLAQPSHTTVVASSPKALDSVPDQTAATSSNQAAVPGKPTVDPLAQPPQTTPVVSTTKAQDRLSDQSAATTISQSAAPGKPAVALLTQPTQTKVEGTAVAQLKPSDATPSLSQTDSKPRQSMPTTGNRTADQNDVLQQINRYSDGDNSNENNSNTLDQVTNVTQLRDVSPSDWAYEALRSLVERYGCIAGYPDGTYRGNRAMTRYEFAAGLNACLQQVERLIASNTSDFVRKEDLATLQRLVDEFRTELATLGTRVDKLESRTAFLESHQFSTTTKLVGEAIFNVADLFGNKDRFGNNYGAQETVFDYRVRLNFDTSFTGKDLLRTRLQAANITEFGPLRSGVTTAAGTTLPGTNITREGRFGYQADTGGSVELDRLFYRFPVTNQAVAYIFANRGQYEDFVPVLNPGFDPSGTGALSRFGRYSPIYKMGVVTGGQGAGLSIGTKSPIRFDLGYLTDVGNNPNEKFGLFDGDHTALGQITFQPTKQFSIAATYVNSYNNQNRGLAHGEGSIASQVAAGVGRPVIGQSYGVEASFAFSPQLVLSGWGAYTQAIVINTGTADVWTYGATLAINDFGAKGNTLGFVVGMEPKLTGSDATVARLLYTNRADLGRRKDPDTGLHVEGFYKFRVTKNILITPGVIWLTAPGHNDANDDIFIGTIRTTFTF